MLQKTLGTNKYYRFFEDWEEFVEYVEQADTCPRAAARGRSSLENSESWKGKESWQECLDFAKYGWPDGVKKVLPFARQIVNSITSRMVMPVPHYDIHGSYVDIGRYVDGEPENMVTWEEEMVDIKRRQHGKILKMVCPISASCYVDQDVLIVYGATMAALADALEHGGYRVELHIAEATIPHGDKGEVMLYDVLVKEAQFQMDLNDISFSLIHPAVLRRFMFAAGERETEDIRSHWGFHSSGGYGIPAEEIIEEYAGDIEIPSINKFNSQIGTNLDKSMEWIEMRLGGLGIELDASS